MDGHSLFLDKKTTIFSKLNNKQIYISIKITRFFKKNFSEIISMWEYLGMFWYRKVINYKLC